MSDSGSPVNLPSISVSMFIKVVVFQFIVGIFTFAIFAKDLLHSPFVINPGLAAIPVIGFIYTAITTVLTFFYYIMNYLTFNAFQGVSGIPQILSVFMAGINIVCWIIIIIFLIPYLMKVADWTMRALEFFKPFGS